MLTNSKRLSAKLLSLVAASAIGLFHVTAAHAGSATANLNVSADVSANCTISAAPLSFGSYDPLSANASSPLNMSADFTVTCTNGASANLQLGQGASADAGSTDAAPLRRMTDGSNFLSYGLFSDAAMLSTWGNTGGTGQAHTGTGSAATLTVYGSIPGGQNAPAGAYSDTVLATLNF